MKALTWAWWLTSVVFTVLTYMKWVGSVHESTFSFVWKPFLLALTVMSATIFIKRFSASSSMRKLSRHGGTATFYVTRSAIATIFIKQWISLLFIILLATLHAVFSAENTLFVVLYCAHGLALLAFFGSIYGSRNAGILISDEHLILMLEEITILSWGGIKEITMKYQDLHALAADSSAVSIPLGYFGEDVRWNLLQAIRLQSDKSEIYLSQEARLQMGQKDRE